MAALTSGKLAVVIFEEVMETFESQDLLIDKVDFWKPDAGLLQNAGNAIWRDVEQHSRSVSGWDLTGQGLGIIEETYPAVLGEPDNDLVIQRIDDMRDMEFWKRKGKASGNKLVSNINTSIANAIATQGSMFYRSNASDGFTFVSEAQALMNERQLAKEDRYFLLNDRDTRTYAAQLAGRQTLQGRPESDAWSKGQIGNNVSEFDILTGSFLPNLAGGASPGTTVTGNQSFAPTAGSVSNGVVTNVDYRLATIPVAASASYNIGDKVYFTNSSVAVNAVSLDTKQDTGVPMTFTIVAKPTGTSVTVFPKPIAINDPALSTLEQAYGNINTRILNGAVMVRANTDTSVKTNLFWNKGSVEVLGGAAPFELFGTLAGKKVLQERAKNGSIIYMVYDGDIVTANFTFRITTWNATTIKDPSACGVAVRY